MPDKKSEQNKTNIQNWFDWNLSDEDLKSQLENYKTLKWYKSYRGISAGLIVLSVIITTLWGIYSQADNATIILSIILYLPLSFFVYRGSKWSSITAIALWTIDKLTQIGLLIASFSESQTGGGPVWIIIFWYALYMKYFWGTYKVEEVRAKDRNIEKRQDVANGDNNEKKTTNKTTSKGYLKKAVCFAIIIALLVIVYNIGLSNKSNEQTELSNDEKYNSCISVCSQGYVKAGSKIRLPFDDEQLQTCNRECIDKYK